MKLKSASAVSLAAQLLGRVKSKKKAASSRRNGLLGGRPMKIDTLTNLPDVPASHAKSVTSDARV